MMSLKIKLFIDPAGLLLLETFLAFGLFFDLRSFIFRPQFLDDVYIFTGAQYEASILVVFLPFFFPLGAYLLTCIQFYS